MKPSTKRSRSTIILGLMFLVGVLSGCGGSDSSDSSSTATYYSIGGTVSGLTGTGLVLQYNGNYDLDITDNSSFTFATSLSNGSNYNVTVLTQPTGQTCTVSNASGILSGSNVTNVTVTCVASSSSSTTTTTNTGLYDIVDTNQSLCYNSSTGAVASCSGAGH
ncbi:MAG: hypothetical protein OQK69_08255, partial [Gammaproteobacteria bacterium]|nr:hypothetical protein [Gammaproteobacteria bacterium]